MTAILRLSCILVLSSICSQTLAATFNVTTPEEFRVALLTAEANGEADTINVATGTYNLTETLSYTASGGEDFDIAIIGADSTTTILDGGGARSILRIRTETAGGDSSATVSVSNMSFENGNATGANEDGGALYITTEVAPILVQGSEFRNNAADDDGGALFAVVEGALEAPVTIVDNTFENNTARGLAGNGDGGAVHIAVSQFTEVDIIDNDFIGNVAEDNGGGLEVEGRDADDPDPVNPAAGFVVLFDNLFLDNSISSAGGSGSSASGGGASIAAGSIDIDRNGFVDNAAPDGGGLALTDSFTNVVIVNSGWAGNQATAPAGRGGGLFIDENLNGATLRLTNNSLTANSANDAGGGIFAAIGGSTGLTTLYNNIIWGNTAPEGADLFLDNDPISDIPSTVEFFNNDATDAVFGAVSDVTQGDNLDTDPMFVDASAVPEPDLRLMAASPLIDRGSNGAPLIPTVDFEDDERIIDGDGDTTATVDIGLDEFAGTPAPSDADLAVTIVGTPDPVAAAGVVTYEITVTNNGPAGATGIVLTDTLDASETFQSATPAQGTCSEAAGVVTCNLGSLDASAATTVTVVAAAPSAAATLSNTAAVTAAETDPNAANDTATETTTVNAPAVDLSVDIAGPTGQPQVGSDLTYTITITNNGPNDETGVALTIALPAEPTFTDVSSEQGNCIGSSASSIDCAIGALANGAAVTVTLLAIAPDVDTTFTVSAVVSGDTADPATVNNTADVSTSVISTVDIVVRTEAGGGSAGVWMIAGLALLVLLRYRARLNALARSAGTLALAGVALLAAPLVMADDDTRWYVGGSIGGSDAGFDEGDLTSRLSAEGWTITGVSVDDSDTAWKVFGGIDLRGPFGIEAAWVDLGTLESEFRASVPPTEITALLDDTARAHDYLADGLSLSAIADLDFAEQWSLIGKVGAYFWEADVESAVVPGPAERVDIEDDGTGLTYGVGLEFRGTDRFSFRAEWERYDVEDWVDMYSVGVAFRF